MSIPPALFCNIRHLSGNIQCQIRSHEVWRPNGQEFSDARQTSKYQVFWRKKHLIMIKHASECFQVVSSSSLLPCLGNELYFPDERVVFQRGFSLAPQIWWGSRVGDHLSKSHVSMLRWNGQILPSRCFAWNWRPHVLVAGIWGQNAISGQSSIRTHILFWPSMG